MQECPRVDRGSLNATSIPIAVWALAVVISDKTVASAKTADPKIKQEQSTNTKRLRCGTSRPYLL